MSCTFWTSDALFVLLDVVGVVVVVLFSVGLQNIVFKFVRSEDMINRIGIGFECVVLWVCYYYGIQTVR